MQLMSVWAAWWQGGRRHDVHRSSPGCMPDIPNIVQPLHEFLF